METTDRTPSPIDETFFDSENDDEDDNVMKSSLLLQYMLDCLHKIFLYDTQRFLSKERADALLSPLVDQVSKAFTLMTLQLIARKTLLILTASLKYLIPKHAGKVRM